MSSNKSNVINKEPRLRKDWPNFWKEFFGFPVVKGMLVVLAVVIAIILWKVYR